MRTLDCEGAVIVLCRWKALQRSSTVVYVRSPKIHKKYDFSLLSRVRPLVNLLDLQKLLRLTNDAIKSG